MSENGYHPYKMKLVIIRGEFKNKVFYIEEGSNLLGRWDPDAGAFPEVDLENEDVEAKVSRKHALIQRSGEQVTLEDIGSLNGTYLNRGGRLEEGVRHDLRHGDEIIIGKIFFRFEIEEER